VPVVFEVRYVAINKQVENVQASKKDKVSTLKEKLLNALEKLDIKSSDVKIQAMWKGQGDTAAGSISVDYFCKNNGKLVVRGSSRITAAKLGQIDGLETLDKLLIVYKTKHNKLAIRALVDQARRNMWKSAMNILNETQMAAVSAYIKDNRQFGQSEDSWKLKIKALDATAPQWKENLKIDPDMFATINAEEYNKVLCAPAHEFKQCDIEAAVAAINSELQGFYDKVLKYVAQS
jgi:hypothetical protein